MRIGFIFIEKYPNYDLDGQLFATLSPQERYLIDSYVRTGLWDERTNDPKTVGDIRSNVMDMLNQGNRRKIHSFQRLLDKMYNEMIYIVQFDSLHPDLADKIHERLVIDNYLGYTEILPAGLHIGFFSILPYRYKLRKGKIHVLYSQIQNDEAEVFAKQNASHLTREQYVPEFDIRLMEISGRFSIFDKNEGTVNDVRVQRAIHSLGYEWQDQIEPVFYVLQDTIPDAVTELISAVEILRQKPLSEADCASLSVNIRRIYEKLGKYLDPKNSKESYRRQLKNYISTYFDGAKQYQDYQAAEIEEVANRIDYMIRLTNKGVHEDWMSQAIATIALRAILTIRELLMPVKLVSPTVHYDYGLFERDDD